MNYNTVYVGMDVHRKVFHFVPLPLVKPKRKLLTTRGRS